MPNLRPPVTTTRGRGGLPRAHPRRAAGGLRGFEPLMTLYLTDNTTRRPRSRARRRRGFVHAVKYYPAGATTNSDSGVTALAARLPGARGDGAARRRAVACTAKSPTPDVDVFDRERVFVERSLTAIVRDFPGSAGSCSSTSRPREAAAFVAAAAPGHRRHDHAAASALFEERALRRRPAPASLLPARPQARTASAGARGRGDAAATRSSFSAPIPPRTRSTRRRTRAAARAATPRRSRSRCTPRRSRPPARSTGSRVSRAISAPISTGCRATATK